MGMKIDIDGSIKELSKWRKDLNYDNGDYCYGDDTTRDSLDVAIDIIRKYQKIQEIVEKWSEDEIDYEGHYGDDYMEKIQEVIYNE